MNLEGPLCPMSDSTEENRKAKKLYIFRKKILEELKSAHTSYLLIVLRNQYNLSLAE